MASTIATMRNSTKESRRNRKRSLWERIRKDIRRQLSEEDTNTLLKRLKSDINELIEIGHVEGYQCGANDERNKGN